MLNEGLTYIENLALLEAIRTSQIFYPLLNGSHILSFSIMVGTIIAYDIAVLRHETNVLQGHKLLLAIILAAFTCAGITGLLLFAGRATHYVNNLAMLAKLGLIVFAGANALWFHKYEATSSVFAKASAILSICLWISVVFAGRWIGFI